MSEIILVELRKPENFGFPYSGTFDSIKAAEARSGCKVWVISDSLLPCKNFIPYESYSKEGNKLIKETTPDIRKQWATTSLLKHLAIYEFLQSRNDISWPVFPWDHDMLVFSDLNEVYKHLLDYDFCVPVSNCSGAYSVHSMECYKAGIDVLLNSVGKEIILNDMIVWGRMLQSGKWRVGDILAKIDGGGAFDTCIHLGRERYVMEPSLELIWGPETKKITWIDGHPYFTELSDNSLTMAHWIHCWGSYKFRTKELMSKAGL